MISDDALLAFAQWCRLNPAMLKDAALLRRVFNAYAGIDFGEEAA